MATVYTQHPKGLEVAYKEACEVAAEFMKLGFPVFCPIAHSHPIATHGELDHVDHDFWMRMDQPMMDAAVGMIVVRMEGWLESKGIRHEIATFKGDGKKIIYVDP